MKYWFESQVRSKHTVWVGSSVFLLFAGVKLILIVIKAPLLAFVWAIPSPKGCQWRWVYWACMPCRHGRLSQWRVFFQRARILLKDSWPLILSGLAIIAYTRIDQIMLGQMMGDEDIGIYSAAVCISKLWYFILTAIVASVFPVIIEVKSNSEEL